MGLLEKLLGKKTDPVTEDMHRDLTLARDLYTAAKTAYQNGHKQPDKTAQDNKKLEAIKLMDLAIRLKGQNVRELVDLWKRLLVKLPEPLQLIAQQHATQTQYCNLAVRSLEPSKDLLNVINKTTSHPTATQDDAHDTVPVSDWDVPPKPQRTTQSPTEVAFERMCEAYAGGRNNKSDFMLAFLATVQQSPEQTAEILYRTLSTISPGIDRNTLAPTDTSVNTSENATVNQMLETLMKIAGDFFKKEGQPFLEVSCNLALGVIACAGTSGLANSNSFVLAAIPVLSELDDATTHMHAIPQDQHPWAREFYPRAKAIIATASQGGTLQTQFATHNHLPETAELLDLSEDEFAAMFGNDQPARPALRVVATSPATARAA